MSIIRQAYPDSHGVVWIEADHTRIDIDLRLPAAERPAPPRPRPPEREREPDTQTSPGREPLPSPAKLPEDPTHRPIITYLITETPTGVWPGPGGEFDHEMQALEVLDLTAARTLGLEDVEVVVEAALKLPWRLVGQVAASQILAPFASAAAVELLTDRLHARMGQAAPAVVWARPGEDEAEPR
ncbi:MAG: hypothetical protein ACK4YQ_12490 [Phenylobacterium sp.]|uniref:hypothetical protein n=1 Tax=Phenylobacterium sp. TaxID=1871053 RepID=UPI00391DBE4C